MSGIEEELARIERIAEATAHLNPEARELFWATLWVAAGEEPPPRPHQRRRKWMLSVHIVLLLIAVILAAVSAFVSPPRVALLGLAVACFAAAFLFG
jgi:hypothetical protein